MANAARNLGMKVLGYDPVSYTHLKLYAVLFLAKNTKEKMSATSNMLKCCIVWYLTEKLILLEGQTG